MKKYLYPSLKLKRLEIMDKIKELLSQKELKRLEEHRKRLIFLREKVRNIRNLFNPKIAVEEGE